jgi:hypothetical protein
MRDRLFNTVVAGLAFAIVMLLAVTIGAQDAIAEEPMAGEFWDAFGSLYGVLATLIVGGLGWLSTRLTAYLSTKHKDAIWAGILQRFNTALFDAVQGRHAVIQAEFAKAKDPKSPGGSRITTDELNAIRDAVWDDLKAQYGGLDGLKKAVAIVAGDDVERWIKNKINGAVGLVDADANPTQPGAPD